MIYFTTMKMNDACSSFICGVMAGGQGHLVLEVLGQMKKTTLVSQTKKYFTFSCLCMMLH
jgi:hypothetical protein